MLRSLNCRTLQAPMVRVSKERQRLPLPGKQGRPRRLRFQTKKMLPHRRLTPPTFLLPQRVKVELQQLIHQRLPSLILLELSHHQRKVSKTHRVPPSQWVLLNLHLIRESSVRPVSSEVSSRRRRRPQGTSEMLKVLLSSSEILTSATFLLVSPQFLFMCDI